MSFSPELKERILVAARREPAAARRQVSRRTRALAAVGVALPLLAFLAVGGARPDGRPLSVILATAAGTLGITIATLVVSLGGRMLGRARLWLVLAGVAAPLAFVVWKVGLSGALAADPNHVRVGYRCLALTFAFALAPLAALFFARRGSDPTHPRSLGLALSVGAAMSAASLVDLWCPVGHLDHLAFGHFLPVVALGLIGIWLGHRFLAVRAQKKHSQRSSPV